jgi:hypothetical protein
VDRERRSPHLVSALGFEVDGGQVAAVHVEWHGGVLVADQPSPADAPKTEGLGLSNVGPPPELRTIHEFFQLDVAGIFLLYDFSAQDADVKFLWILFGPLR